MNHEQQSANRYSLRGSSAATPAITRRLSTTDFGLAGILTLVGVVLLLIVAVYCCCYRRRCSELEFKGARRHAEKQIQAKGDQAPIAGVFEVAMGRSSALAELCFVAIDDGLWRIAGDCLGEESKYVIENGLVNGDGEAYWLGIDTFTFRRIVVLGRFDWSNGSFLGTWRTSQGSSGEYTKFQLLISEDEQSQQEPSMPKAVYVVKDAVTGEEKSIISDYEDCVEDICEVNPNMPP